MTQTKGRIRALEMLAKSEAGENHIDIGAAYNDAAMISAKRVCSGAFLVVEPHRTSI